MVGFGLAAYQEGSAVSAILKTTEKVCLAAAFLNVNILGQ